MTVSAAGARRAVLALALAGLAGGCASVIAVAHVTPLPPVTPLRQQSAADQEWDIKDCQAEAGYQTGYSPTDSPLANLFQKVFFWGTAGASLGGLITGLPTTVESQASEGLIAGAGAGGIAGTAQSLGGQDRYERAWAACMTAKGYAVEPRAPAAPTPSAAQR